MKRIASGLGLLGLFFAVFIWLNHMEFNLSEDDAAMLTITFRSVPHANEICRDVSEAEKALMLPHMRRDKICERSRAMTRMAVLVDGREIMTKSYKPLGLKSDGFAVAVESLSIAPGSHDVKVFLRDTEIGTDWNYRFEQRVVFTEGRRHLIEFQKESGFRLY